MTAKIIESFIDTNILVYSMDLILIGIQMLKLLLLIKPKLSVLQELN